MSSDFGRGGESMFRVIGGGVRVWRVGIVGGCVWKLSIILSICFLFCFKKI